MSVTELRGAPASAAEVAPLLAQAGLPTDDLAEPGRRFFGFGDGSGSAVGVGGLELYGADALLRSVAVAPSCRGRGIGNAIVERMLGRAAAAGATRIYLLTTTAERFFAALGFTAIARGRVPPAIAATREFAALCPDTAIVMTRALTPPR